jgi:hypothetical protein
MDSVGRPRVLQFREGKEEVKGKITWPEYFGGSAHRRGAGVAAVASVPARRCFLDGGVVLQHEGAEGSERAATKQGGGEKAWTGFTIVGEERWRWLRFC